MEKPAPTTFDNLMPYEFSYHPYQALPEPFLEVPREVNHFGIIKSENLEDEVSELNKQMAPTQQAHISSLMPLELLGTYGIANKRLNIQNENSLSNQESCSIERQKFSAQDIVKMAASRYIGLHAQGHGNVSVAMQPLSAFTGLSEGDIKDVELVLLLLAAAEKVSNEQFDYAKQFLFHCQYLIASKADNCIRRVVQIFVQALQERIQREIIGLPIMGNTRNEEHESIQRMNSNFKLMCHDKVPFNQIMQFAAIQSMVEHLSSKTRIHVIDLEPGVGVRWAVFIQALAEREQQPVQMLKITALGLVGSINLEEAKERLTTVASLLNIPFQYDAVLVRDMSEIKEEVFEVEEGEAVAAYCPLLLRTLISRPSTLENLMRVLANLKPCVMLLLEVEANHNSPSFITRFTEALFHYSVGFDVFETCFEHSDGGLQAIVPIMSAGIRSIVAMEGSERTVRNVTIDVWRSFFSRFGMNEVGFSESSYCQAKLVRKRFPKGNHCTIHRNGKALMVGWKGNSFHSVSAWTCP